MRTLLIAGIAAALSAVSGHAADLPAGPYTKAAPVATAYNWTGFYLGGFVGGAFADRSALSTEPTFIGGFPYNFATLSNSYNLSNSVVAGGTIGWNYQPAGTNWLIGLEGEAGYIHVARTVQDINAVNIGLAYPDSLDTTRIGDWYGVIAGRLGWAVDRVLFYGKGGVAFVQKSYSFADNCVVGACGPGIANLARNETQVTWAAGGGVEYAFTPNWSVKGEYLYLATRESYTVNGTAITIATAPVSNVHADPGVHTVKVGFNYRFGGTPIVARY